LRRIGERDGKGGIACNGETGHGEAVGERCGGTLRLERLFTDGREKDGIEGERSLSGTSHFEMAEVRRIKTSSEESPPAVGLAAFGVGWGTHAFMVACVGGQASETEYVVSHPFCKKREMGGIPD